MIFIEIKKWGDFDISYTDSVWYSNPKLHQNAESYIPKLINAFGKISSNKFSISTSPHSPTIGIYCGRKQSKILDSFKTFLKENGFTLATTTQIQFSDESLEYGEQYEGE